MKVVVVAVTARPAASVRLPAPARSRITSAQFLGSAPSARTGPPGADYIRAMTAGSVAPATLSVLVETTSRTLDVSRTSAWRIVDKDTEAEAIVLLELYELDRNIHVTDELILRGADFPHYFAALRSRRAIEAGLDEETIEAGGRGFASDGRFDAAWRWALQYAHTLYREPERIDAIFYAEGKRYWSEAQIMELGAFIALHYGMQAFMRTLHTA